MIILDRIGFYGPLIIIGICIIQLIIKQEYLIWYLILLLISHLMSFELKKIIKQPRPKNIKALDGDYGNKYKYGMPSYHAQLTFFSITFLYLLYGNKLLLIIELLISFIIIYQAYSYNRHTLEQLFVGAFIGIITGYLSFLIIKKFIKNES